MPCEYCRKFEEAEYLHCPNCGATLEPRTEQESLSGFLTKKVRNKLVKNLLIEYTNKELAAIINVTTRTVNRWASDGIPACNTNADKILHLCFEKFPDRTVEILEESQETFRHLTALATPLRHGDVPMLEEVVN